MSERDGERKSAIHHAKLDEMRCLHCGATNQHLMPKDRPKKKKSRGRWSGGGGNPSWEADRPEPNVIIHPECRPHISGNFLSTQGLVCNCDKSCKSFFNCWTGNVDDGDYIAPLEENREDMVKKAKARISVMKKQSDEELLTKLRKAGNNLGFHFEVRGGRWYAHYGGTTWKLDNDDFNAIRHNLWNTAKTKIIEITFGKKGVPLTLAQNLITLEQAIGIGT